MAGEDIFVIQSMQVCKTYSANQICQMVEFLIDNIFVKFGDTFSSGHWNSSGYQLCPLLADLFLYSYESDFLDSMIRSGHRKLARSFNLCFWHTDDLHSVAEYVHMFLL